MGSRPTHPEGPRRASPAPGDDPVAWGQLARRIGACRACPLGYLREHPVVYRGAEHPCVVLVGEAPGAEEDRTGLPFVGRAGRRLEEALREAGLPPSQLGMVNLIKCRPPENRFDRAAEAACRPFLDRQLRLLGPRLLVPLGAHALRALAPDAPRITECSGHLLPGSAPPVFPMLHPAAPLHNPRLRERWSEEVRSLGRFARGLVRQSL